MGGVQAPVIAQPLRVFQVSKPMGRSSLQIHPRQTHAGSWAIAKMAGDSEHEFDLCERRSSRRHELAPFNHLIASKSQLISPCDQMICRSGKQRWDSSTRPVCRLRRRPHGSACTSSPSRRGRPRCGLLYPSWRGPGDCGLRVPRVLRQGPETGVRGLRRR